MSGQRATPIRAPWVGFILSLLVVGPGLAQVRDVEDLQFPALPDYEIPEPEVYELENGLRVFLMEDHELPLVQVNARIRTGTSYDPPGKAGLGNLAGVVQRTGGTESLTGDELDEFLEARAATLSTSVGATVGFASMNCLKEDFDAVFAVFTDVLRAPRFDEDKLGVAKIQANTGIARRNDNVGGITSREFNRAVYGPDSPLTAQAEYATVAAVTRDDLVAWHARYYHPNNVYLGVVGDFDSAVIKQKIEDALGDWQKGPELAVPELAYRKDQTGGVYFVEKKDVTQANIQLGHLGITYDNPDYFAVQVMNEVLGGSFSSRLFTEIRTKRGLAYSVFGAVGASYVYPGLTRLGMQTKSSSMGEAVEALLGEMRRMVADPPSEDELQLAKDAILSSFIFNYASKAQVLAQQMLYAYYGLPADFLEDYRSNIESVTREDVARVTRQYLHPDRATVLVVGNAEEFDRSLDTFGQVTELDISIPEPPDTTPEVARTEAGLEAGRGLMRRVVEALAGGEAGAGITAVAMTMELAIAMGGQSMSIGQEVLTLFPDRHRTTVKTPAGEQVVILNGERGAIQVQGQIRPLPEGATQDQRKDQGRELVSLVRSFDDPELEVVLAGEGEVNATPCAVLAVSLRGDEFRLWVNEAGEVLKQSYRGNHPLNRTPGQIDVHFEDYREVDGWRLPFKRRMSMGGEDFMTVTVESVEIDPEIDPSQFEIPE